MLKNNWLFLLGTFLLFLNWGCSDDDIPNNPNSCENVVVNWGSTQIRMCTDYVNRQTNMSGNYWLLFATNSTGTPVHSISIGFYADALATGINYIPSHPVTPTRPYGTFFFMYQMDIQASAEMGSDSWVKINSIANGKFSGQFKMTAIGRFASNPTRDTTVNLTGTFTDVPLTQ